MTVLGPGPMGYALAAAFAKAGHPTTTWNRTTIRPTPPDTTRAPSAADAVAASPLTVACLFDYDATRAVLTTATDELKGRHLVVLTSGSPESARELATWAADRGITYTDGAIMTPTGSIGTDAAVVLHSGHEIDMARAEGITPTELAPLAKGIGELIPWVVDELAERVEADRHTDGTSNIASAAAGMAHIIATADARGLDASVLRAAHALATRAIDAGHGADDLSRLTIELEEAMRPVQVRVT